MKLRIFLLATLLADFQAVSFARAEEVATPIPHFSVSNMDTTVAASNDFYHYASGNWLKENPVPADKSRWAAFDQLQQRNWFLMREILEQAATNADRSNVIVREVGDFYAAAMDTNAIEALGLKPLQKDFAKIDAIHSTDDLIALVAELQLRTYNVMFNCGASPDAKESSVYAFEIIQGGLSLPDRDYYFADGFAKQRTAFVSHIKKMFALIGVSESAAAENATNILSLEMKLAFASKSRTAMRDPVANYHKFTVPETLAKYPHLNLGLFLAKLGTPPLSHIIVGQPEYFEALDKLVAEQPLEVWKTYLRWHVLRAEAPYLTPPFEKESFAFYGTVLSGQPEQEPRWQRAARRVDSNIGEALGQLFVEKYFPPSARARMDQLIEDLKSVLHDRLAKVDWMTPATRAKALEKFAVFTQKIGYPKKFRDYSAIEIRRDDYLGNVQRVSIHEAKRELGRIGQPVDKAEWHMTPQTVNAYFNPTQNEIVFPAGILQPPFFDVTMDDAVNYGGIGVVIGHEMTHGYDDKGRKFDAQGNLNDWWTEADAKAFDARAQKLVEQFNTYEVLPGLHVNGELTLGENIADLGGASIAYEALERDLARNPTRRKNIDGFTPEQRFFLSFAQIWRGNARDTDVRRRITVDPHSPGQFRAVGAIENLQQFYDAFGITTGAPMWRDPAQRAIIW